MKTKTLLKCLLTAIILIALAQAATAVAIDPANNIQVTDYFGTTQFFSLPDFQALPVTHVQADCYCYSLYVAGGDWAGVKVSDFLQAAQISLGNIGSLRLVASDGYTVVLDKTTIMRPDVIIAYQRDREALPEIYRLVFPNENGAIWISNITSITASLTPVDRSQTIYHEQPTVTQSPAILPQPTPLPTQSPAAALAPTQIPTSSPAVQPSVPYSSDTPRPSVVSEVAAQNADSAFDCAVLVVAAVLVSAVLAGLFVFRRRNRGS